MAGESIKDQGGIGESLDVPATQKKDNAATTVKSKKRGLMSRIWNRVFRVDGDDFEKRLQHISKEEAAVLARMKKRSQSWRRTARHLIIFSVILEVIAVGYAIMTTKSLELNWKLRAFRVLPMFLLPFFASITYSALVRFTGMCDRKGQKTLESLRAERKAKIDELKEKTNYYSTQQLIQRYDPDPAAKAAAATVLAAKLGADSGLKVHLGDESKLDAPGGRSSSVEFVESSGLRNRKQLHTRSNSTESTVLHHTDEEMHGHAGGTDETSKHSQVIVEHHHHQASTAHDGGWIARIAALLVGEDPTDSYALICGSCHMHNGLARKEDFPFITYYCPHCNALNMSKQLGERSSGSNSPDMSSSPIVGGDGKTMNSGVCSVNDGIHASSGTMAAAVETVEGSERVESTAPLS